MQNPPVENHPSKGEKLSFDNTEIAFKNQSDDDLNRAYRIFKMIGSSFISTVGSGITNLAMAIGLPVELLIKPTIFKHFCGGETIKECEPTIKRLAKGSVGSILDYSVEGGDNDAVFDATCKEVMRTIERAKGDEKIPLTVFKITGIGRFGLLEKVNSNEQLTKEEEIEYERIKIRIKKICGYAAEMNVPVMIDAEESWIQDTVDWLSLEMMRIHNKKKAIVYNTYQMYRNDKLASLKADISFAKTDGFILGAKIVRGAYMQKERRRALLMKYPSPIQANKADTDKDYNAAIMYCIENVDKVAFVAGTHNEESCRLLADVMDKKWIKYGNEHIYFSQLMGMSDNLSFNLADAGFNVTKYVPYGPIKEVVPYLLRRAKENTSMSGQMGRELPLIVKEQKRRKLS